MAERPYAALGTMEITPDLDTKFTKKGELSTFLLVYNDQVDSAKDRKNVCSAYLDGREAVRGSGHDGNHPGPRHQLHEEGRALHVPAGLQRQGRQRERSEERLLCLSRWPRGRTRLWARWKSPRTSTPTSRRRASSPRSCWSTTPRSTAR